MGQEGWFKLANMERMAEKGLLYIFWYRKVLHVTT